uniref:Uncharacterized protein n=1 Tax=Timema poppense TaxID=170557 RepID=A0A7R9H144_TIMPO|nr:unnamed protein product [Timema poppensis]
MYDLVGDDTYDLVSDDTHDLVGDDTHDLVGDDTHDLVVDDTYDLVSDDTYDLVSDMHDLVGDDTYDLVSDDMHDLVSDDMHDLVGDMYDLVSDMYDLVGDDMHDLVGDDMHDLVSDDTHDLVGDDTHDLVSDDTHDLVGDDTYDLVGDVTHDLVIYDIHDLVGDDTYDLVLQEFDHPWNLLSNPQGYFSQMVEQTGSTMETSLRKVAEERQGRHTKVGLRWRGYVMKMGKDKEYKGNDDGHVERQQRRPRKNCEFIDHPLLLDGSTSDAGVQTSVRSERRLIRVDLCTKTSRCFLRARVEELARAGGDLVHRGLRAVIDVVKLVARVDAHLLYDVGLLADLEHALFVLCRFV